MSIAVPLYGFGASGGGSGGTLTVTAPANVTVTVSKDGKAKDQELRHQRRGGLQGACKRDVDCYHHR